MSGRGYLPLILVGAAILLFSMAAFTVRETELALKFRFGEIVRSDYQPGLHFLTPFVNNVVKFDKRILTEDYPAEQFLTSEGKILRINFFVKWRISDVSRFYQSTAGGSELPIVTSAFAAGASMRNAATATTSLLMRRP